MSPHPPHAGFTLVELLVAMFIAVALYAVVAGPSGAQVQKQKLAKCAENLRKLHLALTLYANEHDGAFPAAAGARTSDEVFAGLVPRYTSDRSLFTCPATGHSDGRADYAFIAGLRKDAGVELIASDSQLNAEPKMRGARMFADESGSRGGNHGNAGGNLLFTDGHAETVGTESPRDLSPPQGAQLLNPAR
jgi:prepilin-type N-terminal cleavage/methylation domain-containing protein/prepilin-type processing-associated H-X9-DG protein